MQSRQIDEKDLGPREKEVLKNVVAHYINTSEPVGSRTVSKVSGLGLSAATIRNIMADLEDDGYIRQMHPSSGRIPTDKGYRYFVDNLMSEVRLTPQEKRRITEQYPDDSLELEELLRQTSELLCTFTRQTGIVSLVDFARTVCRRVDFIRIQDKRILAVVVLEGGIVSNKVIVLDEPISQEELDKLARFVNDRFGGLSLVQIRERLVSQMEAERRRFDKMLDVALRISEKVFPQRGETEIFVGAKENILLSADAAEIERLRSVFRALKQKSRLLRILNECLSGGCKIFIGKEFELGELSDCSLIARSYGYKNQVLGTLGVIGPTRMQYAKLIAIVDYTAKLVSRLLSR